MKLLEGKKALVTGGSRGIGRAIALRLASEGADVAVTYRCRDKEAADTVREMEAFGVKAMSVKADATDCAITGEAVATVCSEFGSIDILVNNAGIRSDALLLRMGERQWDSVIDANLKSAYNYTKAVLPSMLSARGGTIINISSVVGMDGNAGQSNDAASSPSSYVTGEVINCSGNIKG